MQADFWHARWQENKIGFHIDEVNPYLLNFWDKLGVRPPATVFIPLCGKSLDIGWFLQQGYRVEANELSPIAVQALVEEQGLDATVEERDGWQVWQGRDFRIWCGDFFDLQAEQIGRVDAIYDRASLVALPEAMRNGYVEHLLRVTGAAPQLLVTLSYDQAQMAGPPFSVTDDEVERYYRQCYTGAGKPVASEDVLALNAHFADRGVSSLYENAFVLQAIKK